MRKLKLLLDTNIVIDFLHHRDPFFENTRMLMICGRVGEFHLMISSSQVTDIVFIMTDGGKKSLVPQTLEALREVRRFIDVLPVTESDVDKMLASTWDDPEDGLLVDLALKAHASAIISRDADFPHTDMMPVIDCDEFFEWLKREHGVSYAEMQL